MVLSAERPVSGYAKLSITGSSRRTAITDVGPEVGGLPPLLRRRVSNRVAGAWKPRHRISAAVAVDRLQLDGSERGCQARY